MFFIHHFPSSTYYGITENKSLVTNKLVGFEKHRDAVRVSKSLLTYKKETNTFPRISNKVFILPEHEIKVSDIDDSFYIEEHAFDSSFIERIALYNISFVYVRYISMITDEIVYNSFDTTGVFHVKTMNSLLNDFE
jgi:hypothetical protein